MTKEQLYVQAVKEAFLELSTLQSESLILQDKLNSNQKRMTKILKEKLPGSDSVPIFTFFYNTVIDLTKKEEK